MPTETSTAEGGRAALSRSLHGGGLRPFEAQLVRTLQQDIFRRVDDLSAPEACALSYQRMRYLRDHLDLRIGRLMDSPDDLLALHYWVSVVDGTLTTLLSIHFNLCIGSILTLSPNPRALRPVLDELDSMESIGVFLATELGYGNNVQSLQTRAVFDAKTREFVIDTPCAEAQKFMPNTGADGVAKVAVVMARLIVGERNCGVFPFVVRIRDERRLMPGVRVTRLGNKPGYPLDNAITSFDGVRVPLHHWLSGPESRITEGGSFVSEISALGKRFLTSMERVQMGKLCLSSAALAVLHASLRITLDYARQRRTFAPGRRSVPILAYRRYQQVLFEGVAAAYACTFFLRGVAWRCRSGELDGREAHNRLMALVKALCSYEALDVIAQCRERLGAQGMFSANRVITYWVQVNGIVTAEGDNEVLLARAARELILGLDYELPEIESVPVVELLESPEYLLHLVRLHEVRLRAKLVDATNGSAVASLFETWNESSCDALLLARTHAVRLALESFYDEVDACEDLDVRDVLERLLRLYALRAISGFAAALLTDGSLSPALADQIEPERRRLARDLAANVDTLIDAFGMPGALIDAPILGDYVAAYDCLHDEPADAPDVGHSSFFRTRDVEAPPDPDQTLTRLIVRG